MVCDITFCMRIFLSFLVVSICRWCVVWTERMGRLQSLIAPAAPYNPLARTCPAPLIHNPSNCDWRLPNNLCLAIFENYLDKLCYTKKKLIPNCPRRPIFIWVITRLPCAFNAQSAELRLKIAQEISHQLVSCHSGKLTNFNKLKI